MDFPQTDATGTGGTLENYGTIIASTGSSGQAIRVGDGTATWEISPDLPASLSYHTSEMFSRNVTALLTEMLNAGELNIDLEDEGVNGTMLTHEGKIMNQHVIDLLERDKEENS